MHLHFLYKTVPAPQVACKCTVLHFQTMHKDTFSDRLCVASVPHKSYFIAAQGCGSSSPQTLTLMEFIQQSWWLFCSSAFVVPLRWISPCSWEQTQDLTLGRALWWIRLPFCPPQPHAVISLLAIWEIWQIVTVARCPTSSASPATRAQTWCSISTQNQLIDKHTAQQNIFHTAEVVLWARGCLIHPPRRLKVKF